MLTLIVIIIALLLSMGSLSILFFKMQAEWWKGLIPFYGTLTKFRIADKPKLFILHVIAQVLFIGNAYITSSFYTAITYDVIDQKDGKEIMFGFACAALVCYLVKSLVNYSANKTIARYFYKDEDDAIGMAFLPFIFMPKFVYEVLKGNSNPSYGSSKPSSSRFGRNF